MDDITSCNTKTFGKRTDDNKNDIKEFPIRKLHYLDEKHLIVIDKSLFQKLNFFDPHNTELYFQQELTKDGCIILRPFKMSQ